MSDDGKGIQKIRSVLVACCVVAMVVGLLLIPFVPIEASIGIAIAAVPLYFVIKLLVRKSTKVVESGGSN